MRGREGEEKRDSYVHDGLILPLLPPFLSSQHTYSNAHIIPPSSTHYPSSLLHCPLYALTHYTPFHTALTPRSHYTTDDTL